MATEPRDHQLTIRIPQRIRTALEKTADADGRTVADVVNMILAREYPKAGRK